MDIQQLSAKFAICRLSSMDGVDLTSDFAFLAKTDDEISLVCEAGRIPENATAVQRGYSAFKICGQLDFSLVGIVAGIADILAKARISIFIVSTYDTDYFFVPSAERDRTAALLRDAGYRILDQPQNPLAR